MGHKITALITKLPIDEERAIEYDVPVFKENGYAIIGLFTDHSDYWENKLEFIEERGSSNEIILDRMITHYIANKICKGQYALIQTNYFGGLGVQHAGVFYDNKAIVPIEESAINRCLAFIGVRKINGLDEFDSLQLAKYREFDKYFKKYWDC